MTAAPRHNLRRPRTLALAAFLLALAASLLTLKAYGMYTDSTTIPANLFATGNVAIDDNDSGAAMFVALTGLLPGAAQTRCIKLTYTGSVTSKVRLYGTTGGTGLDPYVSLRATRGTYSADPGFSSCTNFNPDVTDYLGQGAGVIYSGTLQGYADDYAGGLVDPTAGSPESWTNGESHVYRFELAVVDTNSAQGALTATQTFTWEAQNG